MHFIMEIDHKAVSNLFINIRFSSLCTEINHLPTVHDFLGSEKLLINHINKGIFEMKT